MQPHRDSNRQSPLLFDICLVLIIGLTLLILAYITGFPKMSIPDEFVYAVMGRNMAEFKGIYSNYYLSDVLAYDGYPKGDVHMPGYMIILAGSFLLLGPHEFAAFFPSQLTYILSGLAMYWIGRIAFNRHVGLWAAIWLLVFPTVFIWANVVVAETSLVLLAIIVLIIWYRAITTAQLQDSFWLALVIILGMACREVFAIFFLPAIYAIWCWPRSSRLKALLIFGSVFLLGFMIVFLPLNATRASYPWQPMTLIETFDWQDPTRFLGLLYDHFTRNLAAEFKLGWEPFLLSYLSKYFIVILALVSLWVFEKKYWKLPFYFLVTLLPTLLIMLALYDTFRWFNGLRIFAMLMPAGILVACGMLSRLPIKQQYAAGALGTVIFLSLSLWTNYQLADIRRSKFEQQVMITETLTLSNLPKPDVVMAEETFMYGWQNYPVTVIWRTANNLAKWQALRKQVEVDLITTNNPDERDRFLQAIEQGMISDKFVLLRPEPKNGYYIFIRR